MQAAQSRAALPFDAKALTSLGSNEEVRRGLRAAIREGRRGGFTVLQFAGLTLSAQQATPNQVKPRRRRRRPKTPAQREKSAADFEQKRLRSKLLSVLPIVNRIMSAQRNPAQPASALCATASESVAEMTDSMAITPSEAMVGNRSPDQLSSMAEAEMEPAPACAEPALQASSSMAVDLHRNMQQEEGQQRKQLQQQQQQQPSSPPLAQRQQQQRSGKHSWSPGQDGSPQTGMPSGLHPPKKLNRAGEHATGSMLTTAALVGSDASPTGRGRGGNRGRGSSKSHSNCPW